MLDEFKITWSNGEANAGIIHHLTDSSLHSLLTGSGIHLHNARQNTLCNPGSELFLWRVVVVSLTPTTTKGSFDAKIQLSSKTDFLLCSAQIIASSINHKLM